MNVEIEKIRIKVSKDSYTSKPDGQETGKITNYFKNNESVLRTYSELATLLGQGHAVLFANIDDSQQSISKQSIISLSCLVLDIDSKENPITIYEMTAIIFKSLGILPIINYCTFSDVNLTRFRLIYRLEDEITPDVYAVLYGAFIWKFGKYLDKSTSNANRIYQGTNKSVTYNPEDVPISFDLMVKLYKAYKSKLKRDSKKMKAERQQRKINLEKFEKGDDRTIDSSYGDAVSDLLAKSINLKDFIINHFGGNFKHRNGTWVGACPLHGGDNNTAFVIYPYTYKCFTHCGGGNIITAAKLAYEETNFSRVVYLLSKEYGINIPEYYYKGGA